MFALAGCGFSTLAKTLVLLSSSIAGLAAFRVIERLGKGFRGPPRDAWLSAIASKEHRGYAFGVHKALDKPRAVLGPLLAWALLHTLAESASSCQTLFWVACVPALLSLLVLARVKDQPASALPRDSFRSHRQGLSPGFKSDLVPAGVFALGYYSLGFLLLRAHQLASACKTWCC